jgi:hypothetical protein
MKARPVQNVAAKQALACGTLSCGDCLRQPVAITSFVLLLIKKLLFIFIAFLPMLVLLLSKTT